MEKKKESKPTSTNHETDTPEYGNREEQHQSGVVGLGKKNSKTDSPSQDNLTGLNQQYPPILQWPYTPQTTLEHPPPVILKNSLSNQQAPAQNRRNTQQQQPKNTINHVQSQFVQSTGSFWLPRPEIPAPGSAYHTPLGATDSSWQSPMAIGASTGNDFPVSTFSYQGGCSYPMGFPGHWDPTWWGQTQTQLPYAFPYPPFGGGYGFFSVPPTIADGSALGRVHQRGIIRPPEKLSQKHHRLWEAQSAENVHLWASLSRVEAELAACRSRLVKLESELLSLKPTIDATVEGSSGAAAATLAIQSSKKGRPKRPATNALASPDDSQPRPRGRKPGSNKVQAETKGLGPEKDNSNQLEDRAKMCNQMHGIPEETDGKISTSFGNISGFEINGSNLRLASDIHSTEIFGNQIQQESLRNQISGFGLKPTIETKRNGKEDDRKIAFSVLSRNVKAVDTGNGATAPYRGMANGTQGWPSSVLPEACGRNNILGVGAHGFYDNGNVIRQGNKVISGWSFVNENLSEEHEVDEGSGKDDENGEMEEDASSTVAETNRGKHDGTFSSEPSAVMPKILPRLNRW